MVQLHCATPSSFFDLRILLMLISHGAEAHRHVMYRGMTICLNYAIITEGLYSYQYMLEQLLIRKEHAFSLLPGWILHGWKTHNPY